MIVIVALLAALPAFGCRSAGSSVQCALPEPIPFAAPAAPATTKPPRSATARARPRRMARTRAAAPHPPADLPPDENAVTQRVAALVEIKDCTGARTSAHLAGAHELAEQSFARCIAPAAATAAAPTLLLAPPGPSLPPAPRLTAEALKSGAPVVPGSVP